MSKVDEQAVAPVSARKKKNNDAMHYGSKQSLTSIIVKIFLLGIIDSISVFVGMLLIAQGQFWATVVLGAATLIINWIYLRKGGIAAKYLAPGVIFLLVFQVYVVFFSGYISFTNYSDGNNGSMADALDSIQQAAVVPVDGGPTYDLKVVKNEANGDLEFLATDYDTTDVFLGGTDFSKEPFHQITETDGLKIGDDGYAASVDGFKTLTLDEISARGEEITSMRVPISADPAAPFLITTDGMSAEQNAIDAVYDAKTETITRLSDGVKFKANQSTGFFESTTTDEKYETGWRVNVGFQNYTTIFSDETLRGPLLGILLWTLVFAASSVIGTFIIGLALAFLFNSEKLRGKKIYRALIILPYAFPAFLSAYVWKGMFQTENGFINQQLAGLGIDPIAWLQQEGTARWAVLLVNLWLGFPYMFLISTGALQAIPGELTESATIDGASPWQQLRLIKLPLLLISLSPLLISSFAFNFNNFTLIYLITGGGPAGDATLPVDVGGTDLLITFVYKLAFKGGQDYGLASAFSVLIFILIGTISYLGFRRTRSLEEMA
ncbi:ABC transporter permease subunit [Rhodoluna sp.]|uniref:ABC transporter permease subunit n=1 Tax=Rhodoluna sp. TaxID=1969481 RepID=UPI0025E3F26C|nr:ABC transporter permease subunit [Rhodoluna sp.]